MHSYPLHSDFTFYWKRLLINVFYTVKPHKISYYFSCFWIYLLKRQAFKADFEICYYISLNIFVIKKYLLKGYRLSCYSKGSLLAHSALLELSNVLKYNIINSFICIQVLSLHSELGAILFNNMKGDHLSADIF